jgi:lipopolysaccharide transport system permease protein
MDVSVSKSADALEQSELTRTAKPDQTVQPPETSPFQPDKPLITIEPSKGWVALNLRDLWAHRELLYFLTWRDVKVRYKQTALGVLWAILQPVFMMLIFTLFFGKLAGIKTGEIPYPLFAFAGLVPWTFFANSVTSGGNSLTGSAGLITKVYFPRMLVPVAAVAAGFVDFILAFIVLVGLMVYFQVGLTVNMLMLPVLALMMMLFALGIGMWMAALNVKYRDIRFALPFVIQIWLFVSSVIAPSTAVPEQWRWLLVLNPMSGFIEGFRAALFGHEFNWTMLGISSAITLVVLIYSAHAFRRMEKNFADII